MKITYVVQRYGADVLGGAESACRQLARRVAGWADVTVLTTCALEATTWANQLPAGEDSEDGVRIVRHPNVSTRDPGFLRLSAKVFSTPDVPHRLQEEWVRAQGPESPALVEAIRAQAAQPDLWVFYTYLYYPTVMGLPVVGPRAVLHPALHDEPPARLPVVRSAIRSAAALSLQTEEEWELVLRMVGWPPARVGLIGMGIEDGVGDVGALRSRLGLGDDPFLLYLGRVDRGKGTDDLVHAFSSFKERRPRLAEGLKLVVAGPVVHEPPGHRDVVVAGRLTEDERWAALEGCTAFVQPSPNESFGLSLVEALAKGKPALVSSRCTATSGHVRRARAGFAFADPFEFEAGLELLLSEPGTVRRLGASGRAYAEQYLWDPVADRYRRFLERVAASVAPRTSVPVPGSTPEPGRHVSAL